MIARGDRGTEKRAGQVKPPLSGPAPLPNRVGLGSPQEVVVKESIVYTRKPDSQVDSRGDEHRLTEPDYGGMLLLETPTLRTLMDSHGLLKAKYQIGG